MYCLQFYYKFAQKIRERYCQQSEIDLGITDRLGYMYNVNALKMCLLQECIRNVFTVGMK